MNLYNWLYLAIGLSLGWLLAQFNKISNPVTEKENVNTLLQQLKQTQLAYEMAREMSQFKAGFLARTTHELRSPLNGLIGLHQLILADLCENPAEEREFIGQAHERSLKLLKLIDEVLTVARTEHGTNKLNIQPQQLTQILQEVHKLTYMLAANRNFNFTLSLPDPEIQVLADFNWLRQILVSLVDITISQMEEGKIHLSSMVADKNNHVHIWLDVPTHAVITSESIDLMKYEYSTDENNTAFSPGMKLIINQTLLEVMGGKLEILPSPTEPELIRLQISITAQRK
ncbi:HAMP domain-containing sensor histidine kinase [Cronbergia sp. UHCC 0137]|uniref:sensor histidine kinase n=1 Tax=Cronbergia sp. UHCC 0137 TaxID=3110239 RepID=UPI002B21BE24|nr:HAMP domain-containing sensor histidine kinase [Cronbergia sp. UHCC 0137]MEA5617910.1 HAMP domain-containing sensor histidine kinase [Cronbergia sp. UHCC 0137]